MGRLQVISHLLLVVFFLAVCFSPASARNWVIKSDGTGEAPTIQAGIDSSLAGDVVLLESGTYTGAGNRDVSFSGKAITVTSAGGPSSTVIDCQNLGRGFLFDNGESSTSVLSGLTIINGDGGSTLGGGAIICGTSSPLITHNVFQNNTGKYGGAIACFDFGGPEITHNYFSDNTAERGGAIGFRFDVTATVEDNTFYRNTASVSGGGVFVFESNVDLANNWFEENSATELGGGLYFRYGSMTINNNTFYGNTANTSGGGMYVDTDANTMVTFNTLSQNGAASGGGIYFGDSNGSNPAVVNNNIIVFGTQGGAVACAPQANSTMTCNDLFGNAGGDASCGIDGGNNLSADPQFCGIAMTGNFHLQSDSPCAPANNAACGLIGAFPPSCGAVKTEAKTWGQIKAMYQ